MEKLYEWLQSLVCYFILLSAVMHMLPENSYKKYIQYYMGLLLILLLLAPLLRVADLQERIDESVQEFQTWEENAEEWKQKAQEGEERRKSYIRMVEGEEVVP